MLQFYFNFVFLTTLLCKREWEEKELTGFPPAAQSSCVAVDRQSRAGISLLRCGQHGISMSST